MKKFLTLLIATIVAMGTFAQTNLAVGKTSVATSGTAEAGNDGNNGSRWESAHGQDPQLWMVDLGEATTFNVISIRWEGAYGKSFTIIAGNDLGDDGNVQRLHVNALGRLREVFNDTNDMQLPAAMAGGIDPVNDLRSAYHLKRPIQRIYSCDEFVLDSLWMSMPYLVPRAAQLLKDIGRTFQDTVHARGGGDYRIKVTSVLRTEYSASRLRHRNRNASEQSCHRYGTTFDISWTKFDCMDTTRLVSLEDLKNILAEVIQDKRQQGRCYAIYERKQGCFHVTVR